VQSISFLDVYLKESSEIVAKRGFMSEEFNKLRTWWQQNMNTATPDQVALHIDTRFIYLKMLSNANV